MRIEQMFSYRSSFYALFYCTVAASGFLFWLYQKFTSSDVTIFLPNSFRPSKPSVFHQGLVNFGCIICSSLLADNSVSEFELNLAGITVLGLTDKPSCDLAESRSYNISINRLIESFDNLFRFILLFVYIKLPGKQACDSSL